MRRLAAHRQARDSSVESGERIESLNGKVGAQSDPCPTVNERAERIEVLDPLRALVKTRVNIWDVSMHVQVSHTNLSWAYHISLILVEQKACQATHILRSLM